MSKVIGDYRCNICDKKYSSYQSLWIHNKKFHTTNSKPKVSIESSNSKPKVSIESANSKPNININSSLMGNNKIYNCKYCNNIYKHKQSKFVVTTFLLQL